MTQINTKREIQFAVQLDARYRVTIPPAIRKTLSLKPGDVIEIKIVEVFRRDQV